MSTRPNLIPALNPVSRVQDILRKTATTSPSPGGLLIAPDSVQRPACEIGNDRRIRQYGFPTRSCCPQEVCEVRNSAVLLHGDVDGNLFCLHEQARRIARTFGRYACDHNRFAGWSELLLERRAADYVLGEARSLLPCVVHNSGGEVATRSIDCRPRCNVHRDVRSPT
jgi:hypothetical protein